MRQYGQVKEIKIILFLFLFSLITRVSALDIVNSIETYSSLTGTTVNMSGVSELHITSPTSPITGCTINLNSTDSFFFLEQIKPSVVQSTYLSQVRVSGAAAVLNTNCRIVEYASGAVVIPHASSFQPLTVYSGYAYTGTSQVLNQYTYYKGTASFGTLDNNISSFKLKRGYAAMFAIEESGIGISRTYIAQDSDINIMVVPQEMDNAISFIRVYPWRWVSKKGWAGGGSYPGQVNSKWFYDWDNVTTSSLDMEYIPMRHNPNWNAYSNINNKQNSTHALGYNEPDNPDDDGYSTVTDAIAAWPNMTASGLRLVSPAPRDSGTSWLYDFVDQADALNHRVDVVAIHYYRDNESISAIRNWLAGIHNRTGRPIWVTEWNDGCNWTGGDPTDPYVHADRIIQIAQAMDDLPYVERYAVYNACSNRELNSGGTLTPAGVAYQEHISPIAYCQVPGKGGFGCAYYAFENNVRDSLYFKNHGSAQGGATYTTGRTGQALSFDGTNDYVILPENLADCTDFTFAAWVYWNGGNQWQRIFDFGRNNIYYMLLTPRSGSNTLRFDITLSGNSNQQRLETASQLSSGAWNHVAVTLSGNTGRLYLNGAVVATNTNMTYNPSDLKARNNYLGRSNWVTDPFFNGRLDDVRIANYALTTAQIAALAAGTATNTAPVFITNPLSKPDILFGNSINETLIYHVGDYDTTQALTFSKVSGPAWLIVASDGSLSGTPTSGDVGVNSFTVRVTDSAGAYSDATLNITVYGYGLRHHYPFDGNANDIVSSKHGTAAGSPTYTTGNIGQAITLDGTDDLVTLPAGVANSQDITIAAWVYWNGGSQWQRIFDFGTGTNQYLFLSPLSGGNTLRFAIKNGGSEQQIQTASGLTTAAWIHLAVTLSGNTGTLYVNGAAAAANTSVTINPSDFNPSINYIGDSQFTADPLFSGRIDDFRIYNYGLTAPQIAALYNGNTAPVFTTNPINNLGAVELTSYAGNSLAAYAADADGMGTVTFSKVSGPSWLVVAGNGALSGIPGNADVGTNVFTVRATDTGGLSNSAVMNIVVANLYSGIAGLNDILGLASQWLATGCTDTPACGGADLDGDQDVDLEDFADLAFNWLADEDLQLHLKLDETDGTTAGDDSIYSRPGLLVDNPTWSTGHSGGALSFDGAGDYVHISGYKGITGTASRTCCAWVKPNAVTGEILGWGPSDTGAKWIIRVNENGTLRAEIAGGSIYGTTILTDGNWHHIAVVLADDGSPDISEARLYMDGVLETTGGVAPCPVNTGSSQDVLIGAHYALLRYFNGQIDDVRIYNRAMTETEIAALAQ